MKYDLLIRDGEVLDPAAGLKGRLDVAVSGGKIAAVAPSIPENEAGVRLALAASTSPRG